MNDSAGNANPHLNTTTTGMPIASNTTPMVDNNPMTNSPDPMNRPMEQVVVPDNTHKKGKVGAVIGIILAGLILIGGGVAAAILVANMNKKEPVIAAMNKIMQGNAPSNVIIDGKIDITIDDELSPLTDINISLNSGLVSNSLVNNSVAEVTITMKKIGSFTLEFDEIYAGEGDLYFKIIGLDNFLSKSSLIYLLNSANEIPDVIDCGDDDHCEIEELSDFMCRDKEKCIIDNLDELDTILGNGGQNMLDEDVLSYFGAITDSINIIDDTWLKISLEDLNDFYVDSKIDSDISCITTLINDINTNSNSAAELYSNNPFITTTENNKTITSKAYSVYQININDEKFANFVNSIQNPTLTTDLYNCLGWDNNIKVTEEDVAGITSIFPDVFVEVDNNDNFSRLYLESDLTSTDGCNCPSGAVCDCIYTPSARVTIDLNFSYPDTVDITEPEEYVDYSDTIQEIMSGMFTL